MPSTLGASHNYPTTVKVRPSLEEYTDSIKIAAELGEYTDARTIAAEDESVNTELLSPTHLRPVKNNVNG